MDRKLIIQIEEYLNSLPCTVISKLDTDIQVSIEDAMKRRLERNHDSSLYVFLCDQLRKQNFVKKSGLLDEAGFYTYAQISSNTWSNIRWGNGVPSKETLLKLIIGLKMNENDANELMQKGQNSLSLTDPRDRVILALIDIRCYDIYTVYDVLEEYGKHGAHPFNNIYRFEL